ncbi:MAG: cytochrome C, partial [Nitrospirae bacterium]|nr:cytochrome C [Nitrospirota bacterium]
VVTLNSQTGSYSPKALTSSQMSSPWTTNVGNQTMYCSDCHGTDAEASTDPKGPHGSSYKYMLKGTGKYWPTKSDGSTLWRLNTTDAQNTDLFCKNCHPIYDGSWKNNAHSGMASRNPYCVNCHVAVPHGSKRSRLIGYNSDPAPYDYNNSYLGITGFKKAGSPTGYAQSNCSTNCGGHGGSVSGADP